MLKYCTHLHSKNSNVARNIECIKREIITQSEFLEEDKRKLTIFDAHNYKINLPSQFFLNISDDFIEKINYFKKTIEDYEILFQNLYIVNYLFYVITVF